MRATTCLVTLWFGGVVLCGGCQGERTTPVTSPAVNPPRATGPAQDVPPVTPPGNPTTVNSVNRGNKPALPDAEKSSLIYQAKLDLLRILICCDEGVVVEGRPHPSSAMQQVVAEHFSNMGFRVLDGSPCPEYTAPPEELALLANERDVDLFVLLRSVSTPVDKFGEFYSFEVDGRSKVVQISGNELLTTRKCRSARQTCFERRTGGRERLKMCGEELAKKLSDEIVRKSSRGRSGAPGSRRGLAQFTYADWIRVDLEHKPGIQSVALSGWTERTGTAIFWVRLDAGAKENLGAYLEQLDQIQLHVQRLDQTGAATERR